MNISDDKLNSLLGMASKKLGQDPEQIKEQLQAGNVDALVNKLDPKTQKQVNGILQNPKALEAMMNNEAVKKMLGNLTGGQK